MRGWRGINLTDYANNVGAGFQIAENQSTLSYLMDICHERAMLSSVSAVAGQRSSLLTAEDLANIRHSMDSTSPRNSVGGPGTAAGMVADKEAALGAAPSASTGTHLSTGPVIMRGDTASGPAGRVMLLRRALVAFRNVSV